MSVSFPPEVWRQIFTRLPVKSILRIRSVCKEFHLLISDPAFRKAYKMESGNNHKLLLRHMKHKYLMLNDEHKDLEKMNGEEIKFPLEVSLYPRYCIVGCIDGVVCLCKDYSVADQIVLWNPSIRKCMYLPKPEENNYDSSFYCVLGFGFDPKTNDYKVVRLTYLKSNVDGVPPRVELFKLSSQSWRTLINNVDAPKRASISRICYAFDGGSFVIHKNTWPQTYLNGALHWIGYEPKCGSTLKNLIISFNMSDESFGKITFPDVLATESAPQLSLSVSKKKLSLIQFENTSGQERYSIWLMEEYGQAGSWIKHYTIDWEGKISKMIDFRKNGEPIMATKKGHLVTYDTETKRMRSISGICGAVDSFLVVGYIDSFVLLDQKETKSHVS